jgi:lysyl-tRNA synthetase class 2
VVAFLGVVSVVSAIYPPVRRRLDLVVEIIPAFAPEVAAAATAAAGLLLIGLSRGLRRGKRRAWQVAVVATCALVVLHLIKGLDVEEAALSASVLALLMTTRSAFIGIPDPRSGRHVGTVLSAGLAAATLIGVGLIVLDPDEVSGSPGAARILKHVWWGLIGIQGPLTFTSSRVAARIAFTLLLLGTAVAALTLSAALRPAGGPHRQRPDEAERLRALLAVHGYADSLGYFALRDDKSVLFSPTGKSAVAYRVVSGVSLASGDPLGDHEAWPGAIAAWLDEARAYAWVPAVLGASEFGARAYHRAGLDALELGDEAIVTVADFTLEGRPMRGVRQAVTRLRRRGFTVHIDRLHALPHDDLTALAALTDGWRDGQVERGFSMALGRFGDPRDPDVVVARCLDGPGAVVGVLTFVPWGPDGLSLDLMRRAPDSDNGVMELIVTSMLAHAPTLGVRRLSLNFAVFRAVFERGGRLGAGPVLRLWHRTLLLASRFWQIESLYRANAKYRPTWEPRFLCFLRARELPRIGAAALMAEAFVHSPRWLPGVRQ